jgi:hypothetical protein
MRILAIAICLMASAVSFAQETQPRSVGKLQLAVSDDEQHFSYSIPHPERVRNAWIEVWDRPVRLDRKTVAIQASGTLAWEWDRAALNGYEDPDDNLEVSIWDPNGETITCDVNTVMRSEPGGIVSSATVGGRQQFTPAPALGRSWIRASQGSGPITFDVVGMDLGPGTKFRIDTSRGGRCGLQSLHARVMDLAHARITLDAECLRKPGILKITTLNDTEHGAAVHVASSASPHLNSVTPSSLPDDLRQDQMKLILRGRGFTKESAAFAGYDPDINDFQRVQLWLETEYISSTELRVQVDGTQAQQDTVAQPPGEKLRVWVKGNEERFELSRPFDVTLRPTGRPLPEGRLSEADFRRWKAKTAIVTSVSPLPIRLMNERSPKELEVTIRGENFSPQDKVHFAFGNSADNDKEVRSEYISPTMLRAWLPRQFWRKHAVSYRLVVETTDGKRHTRQIDEKDEE